MTCPVALFADATVFLLRAGLLLTIRLTSAVALAATAFSVAILVADHFDRPAAAAAGWIAAQKTYCCHSN